MKIQMKLEGNAIVFNGKNHKEIEEFLKHEDVYFVNLKGKHIKNNKYKNSFLLYDHILYELNIGDFIFDRTFSLNGTFVRVLSCKDFFNYFEIIKGTTPPKRIIFDLTEQELEELARIAIGNEEVETLCFVLIETRKNIFSNGVSYVMFYNERNDTQPFFELYICDNLDFRLISDYGEIKVNNQIKLRNRLNEMLNQDHIVDTNEKVEEWKSQNIKKGKGLDLRLNGEIILYPNM